jgi:hypothetical protein
MPKQVKFHKHDSPAFHEGQEWFSTSGNKVHIMCVFPWPICNDKWNYSVRYRQSDGSIVERVFGISKFATCTWRILSQPVESETFNFYIIGTQNV